MHFKVVVRTILFIFCLLHVQANENDKLADMIRTMLLDLVEIEGRTELDLRSGDKASRQDAVDRMLAKSKLNLEEWVSQERAAKQSYETAFATGKALQKFVSEEAREGITAQILLEDEKEALQQCYEAADALIVAQEQRKQFLQNNYNIEKQWEFLSELNADECKGLKLILGKMHYRAQVAFVSWQVLADGFVFAMKQFSDDMYLKWTDCVNEEEDQFENDNTFPGLECELEVADEGLQVVTHLKIIYENLIDIGNKYDEAVDAWEEALNQLENPDECVNIDGFVEEVQQLKVIIGVRKENEELFNKMNAGYVGTFNEWLATFQST